MTTTETHQSETLIIGAGLAGIVSACELLDKGKQVILVDRAREDQFGGLAENSFGGITIFNSPLQKSRGIKDSFELGYKDWLNTAQFGADDAYPKKWAMSYIEHSRRDIYEWLREKKINFFPFIHWVERGLFHPGNSVPRFHMVWGTGHELIAQLKKYLYEHPKRQNLKLLYQHEVQALDQKGNAFVGCSGIDTSSNKDFKIESDTTIIASGGICGSIKKIRAHWHDDFGTPPETILNGSHPYADGKLHDVVSSLGGQVTHLDKQWHYAAGVHHPKPKHQDHGLSLVPPKSALWLNHKGERIGPVPLITAFDTRYLVEQVCRQEKKYSWQVLNWKIAVKELAVSGSEYNDAIKEKKLLKFIKNIVFGNKELVSSLIDHCQDFLVADNLPDLVTQMNGLTKSTDISLDTISSEILAYDNIIDRGPSFHSDDQLRRIEQVRHYMGDRLRTCKFSKILDPKNGPLIAIREFIVTRKSLGGIKTNLNSRVLGKNDVPMDNLFAIGEAAGFGGGGIHGRRSLEGTFLGSCILTGLNASREIC